MTTKSRPTHQVARRCTLADFVLDAGEMLDLSDGVLRLPPSAIQAIVSRGLLLEMSPKAVATREIEAEADRAVGVAREELAASLAATRAMESAKNIEISRMFGASAPAIDAARAKLTGQVHAQGDAAHAAFEESKRKIEAQRLAKLAAL